VTWSKPNEPVKPLTERQLHTQKRVPDPLADHAGAGERGVLLDIAGDRKGRAHAGLINTRLGLAVEMTYPVKQLPRLANWQHFGPRGSYVTGLEPFSGSLFGKEADDHPTAEQYLEPGASRQYDLTLAVLTDKSAISQLTDHDGPVQYG
jgi:hypothetical protein